MAEPKAAEQKSQAEAKEAGLQERASAPLKTSLESLKSFGQFKLFATVIRKLAGKFGEQYAGLENMEPGSGRKARFLTEATYSEQRKILKKRLQTWRDQLASEEKLDKLVANSIQRSEKLTGRLNENLRLALDASRELERSYRTMASFFTNAEKAKGAKVEHVSIMNAASEQLKDRDNPLFLEKIANELEDNYNRLGLMDNYSLLVIPGFLGSAQDVDRYAEVAARCKVMLFTDFIDAESVEDVLDNLEHYQLTGAEEHKAYVCMACNYVAARPGFPEFNEPVMFIPPSSALAGKIYSNATQVATAGNTFGRLKEVDGVRFPIKQTELGDIAEKGMIPITFDFGKAMAFSDFTLFDGDNPGYKKYPVVRTFDSILKSIKDLLARFAFRNIDADLINDISKQINKFLDANKGSGRLIQDYEIKSLRTDPDEVDKVLLELQITPWFAARMFDISLIGREGENNQKKWEEKVSPA